MFSRRHPFLFFLLVFSALSSATLILVSLIVALGMKGTDLGGLGMDDGEKVGVVEIVGVIAQSRDAIEQLKRFREDDAIRAIVIRVDSPGGVVGPSQEIYREIIRTKATKKGDRFHGSGRRLRGILRYRRGRWHRCQSGNHYRQHRGDYGVYQFPGTF